MNDFMNSIIAALENEQPTDKIMDQVGGAGNPDLPAQQKAMNDETGNTGAPGDPNANPVGEPDPDHDPNYTDLPAQKASSAENADHVPTPGDPNGNPNPTGAQSAIPDPGPASEMEGFHEDTLFDFEAEVKTHKSRDLIPLKQEKQANNTQTANTGDPATEPRTPVSPSGDSRIAELDKFIKDSYDVSGSVPSPGVNGTPVSKSGDSKPLPKNEAEKIADDKDGNPPSPGVNGNPAPSFESFIGMCKQLMTEDAQNVIKVPENMTLESYALELGMGRIAAMAMEATLTAAQRRALKDSDFGLPKTREWPLNDETHVRSAITNFHWCPKDKQRELARNILKAMRKYGMKDVRITEGNPFAQYCPDAIVVPRKKKGEGAAQQA